MASTNGAYLIKYKGRRYFYYCTKMNKLDAYKIGKFLRNENSKTKYAILKGKKWGWNVYITRY